jgi:hypothetical protein
VASAVFTGPRRTGRQRFSSHEEETRIELGDLFVLTNAQAADDREGMGMMRGGMAIYLCWVLVWPLVDTQGIAGVPPDTLQQLASAEARWATTKPAAYEFRVEAACNGLIPPRPPGYEPPLMRVRAARNTTEIDPSAWSAKYDTVEKQFAFIRTAWNSKPVGMNVEYDQRLGHPIRVCVDPTLVTDDEFGFVVTDFKVLSGARQFP